MTDLRYPIGKFEFPEVVTQADREKCLREIEETPLRMREAVHGLVEEELETPYREGGWTARQVVHHIVDSHINSYVRFRLALTEDEPVIKPYLEGRWAELPDARSAPVELSLAMLESLHARWMLLLRSMGPADWARPFRHPERGLMTLERNLALYAWHGKHHVAHVMSVRRKTVAS